MSADRKNVLWLALMLFFLIVVWAYQTIEFKAEIEQLKFEASFQLKQRDYGLSTMEHNYRGQTAE